MIKNEFYTLSNGVKIPKVGFGTWQTKSGEEAFNAVTWALKAGYTHIDTAHAYENEASVAEAIIASGVKREDIFITTKLPSHIKTYDGCIQFFNESLQNLKTDYIDLYLIHAPWPWSNIGEDCTEGNIEAWKAMIDLYNQKKIRAIGVSNFHVKDIKAIVEATGVWPMANQIRYFIGNRQDEITNFCQANNILIQAYSPMATSELLGNPEVIKMAEKYNKSVANICVRYCIQKNTNPLPKSVHEDRIYNNIDLDFEISKEDMDYLDSLHHIASTRQLRD